MKSKIIDAFMFYDELAVLEIRLNELDPVVDHFVIVESLETHGSRRTKPAILAENWDVVKPFEHKIKYVVLPHLEPEYTDAASGWKRENFQRLSLMPGILSVSTSPEDVVILSDCDEIPRAKTIRDCFHLFAKQMYRLNLDLFWYNVNRYVGPWCQSTVGTISSYQREGGLQQVRNHYAQYALLDDAGWHFSYFGDVNRLRAKIEDHAESYDPDSMALLQRSDKEIAMDVATGKDMLRRGLYNSGYAWRETNDPRLPAHFLNNIEHYRQCTEAFFREKNRELLHG